MDLSRYSFLLPLRGGSGHCKVALRRIPWHKHDRVLQAFVGEGEAKPPDPPKRPTTSCEALIIAAGDDRIGRLGSNARKQARLGRGFSN